MIKVGIVGCGYWGDIHLRVIKSFKNVHIVGICDHNLDKARRLAARENIGLATKDMGELLGRTNPDAIHIVTPPTSHESLVRAAIRAGCHVFVEKPMALTSGEASLMIATSTEHDRLLTVGHNYLFEPAIREAHRHVSDGRLGKLIGINVFHNSLPIYASWISKLPSGRWINDFDHLLYLSEYFMGDVQTVQVISVPTVDGSKVAELHVATQNSMGWSSLTYSTSTAPFQIRLTLFGSKRTLEVDLLSGIVIELRHFNLRSWMRKGITSFHVASQLMLRTGLNAFRVLIGGQRGWSGLRVLLTDFYAAINNGTPSPVSARKCMHIIEVKEEIQRLIKGST